VIDPNKKENAPVQSSDVCRRAFELMHEKRYDEAEKLLVGNMAKTDDESAIALYHSVLGVLFKLQGEYKTAWKHYERAEKLLPLDPALKIISARLLLEQFAQYDQAIKKAKKVFDLIPNNPVFAHQAHTTLGLAYLKKGEKKKAIASLQTSVGEGFYGFVSAKNIDFSLVEALLRKNMAQKECVSFFEKALRFATKNAETKYVELFQKMMNVFERDYGQTTDSTD